MRSGAQSVQRHVEWRELLGFWRFLEEQTRVASLFPAPAPCGREAFRYPDESAIRPFEGGRV